MKFLFIIGILLLQSCTSTNNQLCEESVGNCTFVLFSEEGEIYNIVNRNRAEKRFTPASTFKIANSLIALETDVIISPEKTLPINNKYPPQPWWQPTWTTQDYNLKTAFQNSVFPIYQGIANDIGDKRMSTFLSKFKYGNQDISSGIDTFWLNGSLRISAFEQIEFLKSIYNNDFQIKEKNLEILLDIMLVEETDVYKLYAKTGSSLMDDGSLFTWYVGFIENDIGAHFFAFNLNGELSPETNRARIDLTVNHLKDAGVI